MKHKDTIIQSLKLQKHREGGYFAEIHRSTEEIDTNRIGGKRSVLTSIYYMLTDDSPIGHFHINQSDIVHYFHIGDPILYLIVHPNGHLEKKLLGLDIEKGHQPQLIVKGGCWKASVLQQGTYGLIGEAVAPGFDYRDSLIAEPQNFRNLFPQLWSELAPYVSTR